MWAEDREAIHPMMLRAAPTWSKISVVLRSKKCTETQTALSRELVVNIMQFMASVSFIKEMV